MSSSLSGTHGLAAIENATMPPPVRGEGIIFNCPGDETGNHTYMARARRVIRAQFRTLVGGLEGGAVAAPTLQLEPDEAAGSPTASSSLIT